MKPTTLQNDPDVKIPAAVRAAAARSEEMFNQLRDGGQVQEPVTQQGNPELDAASLAQTTQQPEPTEPPAQQAETQPSPDSESWEHKYKSIHGRYMRSQEQIRAMSEQISNLQRTLAAVQAAPPATAEATTSPQFTTEKLITDEEVSDYGEDFLKVVGKKAREELAPVVAAYQAKIAELEQKLGTVSSSVQGNMQEKLLAKLDSSLPGWRDVNSNPEFLDWLRLPDPYSGAIRHDMLKAAYAQGDSHRVLAYFNGFLAEEAAMAPAGQEPDAQVTKVAKVPLASLAAPGRAKTAASASAPAEKPIITRAQIGTFYADLANGKYRGRDAEKNRLEAMIFEAQRDGRIR